MSQIARGRDIVRSLEYYFHAVRKCGGKIIRCVLLFQELACGGQVSYDIITKGVGLTLLLVCTMLWLYKNLPVLLSSGRVCGFMGLRLFDTAVGVCPAVLCKC